MSRVGDIPLMVLGGLPPPKRQIVAREAICYCCDAARQFVVVPALVIASARACSSR